MQDSARSLPSAPFICYEEFGAKGDGVTDDLPAICAAHAAANAKGLPVRSAPDATYHLGGQPLTAEIATGTDWSTSRFTVDDTLAEDHETPVFHVRSLLEPVSLEINHLVRDQARIDLRPGQDCHVLVENGLRRLFIRRGPNQDEGFPQQDCFVLRRDGSVEGMIDWTYDTVTRLEVRSIDEAPLSVRGGVFTTFANQREQGSGYTSWTRNIRITRSNTRVEGLTHYVVGETSVGQPYGGFLDARSCANLTIQDCFFSGHKIYSTLGSAGQPVLMGSYDVHANHVVNLHLIRCRMNHILDRTRWGVIASNFCKNILLEDCEFSRMDSHKGVSGTYTVRRCVLGHMGLNAIGRGQLTVEDSTLYGPSLISFRADYGSTWDGAVLIRHCRWVPACGDPVVPILMDLRNDGMHDFGYACSMPREITIEGLQVEDRNAPPDYACAYLLRDPEPAVGAGDPLPPLAERPFPYARCRRVTLQGLVIASGKPMAVSSNPELSAAVKLVSL